MVGDFFVPQLHLQHWLAGNVVWQNCILIINELCLPNNIKNPDTAGDPA
jgi:hypothetical protein